MGFLISLHEPLHLRVNDNLFYLDIAQHGIVQNSELVSPFAYRFVTPLLAGGISSFFSISPEQSFYTIAILCAITQLFLVFVLAKRFQPSDIKALIALSVVALSYYNVRFLIADSLRPDHLAYPLMLVVILLLLAGRRIPALLLALAALNVREFFLIPAVVIGMLYYQDYLRRHRRKDFWMSGAAFFSALLVFMLQRVFIRVSSAAGYLEPLRYDFIQVLLSTPLNMARNLNILLALAGYLLPLLLIVTPERWRAIRLERRGVSLILTVYSVMVFGLTYYGGTDIGRFVTYLFIPMVIWMVMLLNRGIPAVEIIYMLIVVALYNRILVPVPQDIQGNIDFQAAFADVVDEATWRFFVALAVSFAGVIILRRISRPAGESTPPRPVAGEAG